MPKDKNNSIREAKIKSPWLDVKFESLLNTEFECCRDRKTDPSLRVNRAIDWLCQNGVGPKLRKILAKDAPLLSVNHAFAETWISPPPSGAGNTVVVVAGFDQKRELRLVHSNWCQRPQHTCCQTPTRRHFFEELTSCSTAGDKTRLLQKVLNGSLRGSARKWSAEVHEWCRIFRTMPVHIIVVTDNEPVVATFPAVIHGVRFCDFSLESAGEV